MYCNTEFDEAKKRCHHIRKQAVKMLVNIYNKKFIRFMCMCVCISRYDTLQTLNGNKQHSQVQVLLTFECDDDV